MTNIEKFDRLYSLALEAKRAYDVALAELRAGAAACKVERDSISSLLHSEHPELVKQLQEAYKHGERIKDEMQKGGRWPKPPDASGTRYVQILAAVPIDQRSPELIECLEWWEKFEVILHQIEVLYPAPKHFQWNVAHLAGPNLWLEFGIALDC